MNIGARLQAARERRGYSIADVCGCAADPATVSRGDRAQRRQELAAAPVWPGFCQGLRFSPRRRFRADCPGFLRTIPAALSSPAGSRDGAFAPDAHACIRGGANRHDDRAAAVRRTSPSCWRSRCEGARLARLRRSRQSAPRAPALQRSLPKQHRRRNTAPPVTQVSAVVVELDVTAPAWVTATVDGTRAVYRTMQPGEHETLRGRDNIALRVGNAGAIRWAVNGRHAEMMGAPGAVRSVRVSAE